MHIVHLTASTFFGGPERQMLGLAVALPSTYRTSFLSFSEHGKCADFLQEITLAGFEGIALDHDTPRLRAAVREITEYLQRTDAAILCCHGYKANLLGRLAARRAGIPVVAVSRGWTGETTRVRMYETLDRLHLRYMDRVVCVSKGQAYKVRRAGVPTRKIRIIRNSARIHEIPQVTHQQAHRWSEFFSPLHPESRYILAAGRLSPEKGFPILVDAAATVCREFPAARFVLFGEGAQRPVLERKIESLQLQSQFHLAGFRSDLDTWFSASDLVVLPSFTEGLPNVALEGSCAGVAVVATAVGGTPEVVRDNVTGKLVPSGDPEALARAILTLMRNDEARQAMGAEGRRWMQESFTFAAQARAYERLFVELVRTPRVGVVNYL